VIAWQPIAAGHVNSGILAIIVNIEKILLNAILGREEKPLGVKFKMQGQTISGTPLCRSCRNATYIQGESASQRSLHCNRVKHPDKQWGLPYEAYECSQYDDKRLPSRDSMEATAWILRSDGMTKKIGFISPEQRRKNGEYVPQVSETND
jgi:hypothetical protein